jgi:hypothetical protein
VLQEVGAVFPVKLVTGCAVSMASVDDGHGIDSIPK